MNKWAKPVAIVAAVASALVGCTNDDGSTKAGGGSSPVTLRIGTNEGPGVPEADQIEEFARQVESLSEGRLIIEPVWEAAGNVDDREQVVARMVVGGELDMGLIPARAWDTEGVKSLRALQTPFLVTSDELVAAVITSDMATVMLGGLEALNVAGLALLPTGLRHLFVFGDDDVDLFDLNGKAVRAPTSETTKALFTALGATVDDYSGDAFPDGVRSGTIHAAESDFVFASCCMPAWSTVAGNLTLYPKVNSLVINAEANEALDDDQQHMLRDAATRTLDWAVNEMSSDADRAAAFCDSGGTVVSATDSEIAATEQAVAPVYEALQQDATTKELIERIRTIKADLPAPPPIASCGPDPIGPTGPSMAGAESEFPDGVYRMEITAEFLIQAGVDRATAVNHAGMWTLAFDDGFLTIEDTNASTGKTTREEGVYCIAEGRITLGLGPLGSAPTCGDFWDASWTLDGDQLRFTDLRSATAEDLLIDPLFGGQPFTKIG